MSRYSDELKQAVLKRMLPPESRSVAELARETGITEATLYNWRKVARRAGSVMPGGGKRKAQDWDSAAKFAVVLETANLTEEALESWTPLIGQSLDDDKCFLQDERDALERSNETEKTKPFA